MVQEATLAGGSTAPAQYAAMPKVTPVAPGTPIFYRQPEVNTNDWTISKSYAYGYNGQDTSREEVSDDQGTVTGSYTTIDSNGNPLVVRYSAGANQGFVVENLNEVLLRSVPNPTEHAAAPSQPASVAYSVHQEPEQPPLPEPVARIAPPPPQRSLPFGQDRSNIAIAQPRTRMRVVKRKRKPAISTTTAIDDSQGGVKDRSYSFGFQEEAHSRHEQADNQGNIRGQYSYVNAEGNQIVVKYKASPDKGFEIENESELSQSVARATLDGARRAAAFRSAQHRQEGEARKVQKKLILIDSTLIVSSL